MSRNTQDHSRDLPSIGVEANSIDRYTHVRTNDDELLIFDEELDSAWIQSTFWIQVESME